MRHQAFAVSQFDSPTCSFNSKNTSISYVRASLLILLTHRNGEKAPRHLRLLLFADELVQLCTDELGSLLRHTPELGAVCGKASRKVLCGGRATKRASLPLYQQVTILLRRMSPLVADSVAKVENRTTLKI